MKPNTTHSKSKTFHQGIEIGDVIQVVRNTIETEETEETTVEPKTGELGMIIINELKTKYVVTVTKYDT